MSDLNNACFSGRLTTDATMKRFNTGSTLLTADLAVNTGSGQYAKTTMFKIKCWSKQADVLVGLLKRGTQVTVSGEVGIDTWNGITDVTITCFNVNILAPASEPQAKRDEFEPEGMPDDIPF